MEKIEKEKKVRTKAKPKESKHLNHLGPSEIVQIRKDLPSDYHCDCNLCDPDKFLGDIFHNDSNKYYSNRIRGDYYLDKSGDHLDVGQMIGYRWAIQNLCPPGGLVFDPTVGSGTAIVEAINNGRNAIGIELEYPQVALKNIGNQITDMKGTLVQGDARNTAKILEDQNIKPGDIDLIINGTPYPAVGKLSSDAPQRHKMGEKDHSKSFNYNHQLNMGLAKGDEWKSLIQDMYTQSLQFLKSGGYFVILVKDMIRNKAPYNLHKTIIDLVLEKNPDVKYHGFILQKHIPTTMFISTYGKQYPGVKVPLYQTGIILKKD